MGFQALALRETKEALAGLLLLQLCSRLPCNWFYPMALLPPAVAASQTLDGTRTSECASSTAPMVTAVAAISSTPAAVGTPRTNKWLGNRRCSSCPSSINGCVWAVQGGVGSADAALARRP